MAKTNWKPRIVFLEGNHEYRMWREILKDRRNLRGIPLPELVCKSYDIPYFVYQQAVDIDGDGSFLMNVQELATASAENIAAKAMI